MKPAMGGYTLLEVLIFLAVSSVLLAISNVVLQGQSARTEFTASMNDVTSKMQQWIDQVKNGYSASNASSSAATSASAALNNYNCTIDALTQSPKLEPGSVASQHAIGTNLDCVFLGKAIMINDKFGSGPKDLTDKIYAYTVLGRRTYNDGTGQVLVNNLKNSNAVAALRKRIRYQTVRELGVCGLITTLIRQKISQGFIMTPVVLAIQL
jgi:Tfp pilus assembly protein PilE